MARFTLWETDDRDGTETTVRADDIVSAVRRYGLNILNDECGNMDEEVDLTVESDGKQFDYTLVIRRTSTVEAYER